ncbi:putative C2 domain-containing protein [Helianthus annuus]|nr:putative C2 domain-containing protein [Helianthus annuus]
MLVCFLCFFLAAIGSYIHQKAQTTIMRSNLNPIWNEDLMLAVPEDYGPVKLVTRCSSHFLYRLYFLRILRGGKTGILGHFCSTGSVRLS